MVKVMVVALVISASSMASVYADQTSTDYAADKGVVDANRGKVLHTDTSLLPSYEHNPTEQNYYHGVATSDSELKAVGKQVVSQDQAGGTVVSAFLTRDQIKINTDSPDFDDSNLVKADAHNITHGISDQYIDCNKHQSCKIVTEQHDCIRTNTVTIDCTRIPKVTVDVEPFLKPVPKPCTHIVVVTDNHQPPKGSKNLANFDIQVGGGFFGKIVHYHVYGAPGVNETQACYLPGTLHVEHDRNQHGTSQLHAIGDAFYLFYAQAFYVNHWGVGDLHVKDHGKVIAHVQSDSNTGAHSTSIVASKDSTYVLDGVNWGFTEDNYTNAWSIYWAATPLKQTHKVPHVRWQEDCGGSQNA